MGCDIHDYCEIYKDGHWEMLGKVFPNYYYGLSEHPYAHRNYGLFGLLAGVRDSNILPLTEPKGVPVDASDGYLAINERWMGEGHDHSYHTLQELIDYPLYDEKIDLKGWVKKEEYKFFKENGYAKSYCHCSSGSFVILISNQQMDEYISDPNEFISKNGMMFLNVNLGLHKIWQYKTDDIEKAIKDKDLSKLDFYTKITWQESIRDHIGKTWFECLEIMKQFAPDGDYNKIRMVFFFDN